jgi:hypothetical protein
MSESIPQKDKGENDQWLNAERLIQAVRGSRAARVLYELRPWLELPTDQIENGTAFSSAVPPSPSATCAECR